MMTRLVQQVMAWPANDTDTGQTKNTSSFCFAMLLQEQMLE